MNLKYKGDRVSTVRMEGIPRVVPHQFIPAARCDTDHDSQRAASADVQDEDNAYIFFNNSLEECSVSAQMSQIFFRSDRRHRAKFDFYSDELKTTSVSHSVRTRTKAAEGGPSSHPTPTTGILAFPA